MMRSKKPGAPGETEVAEIVGDTNRLLRHERTEVIEIEGLGPRTEILQLVSDGLAAQPERADLWMMRFEVQRTLGMKAEFAAAAVEARKNPRVAERLDWDTVRALWQELAPDEPLPGDSPAPAASARAAAPPRPGTRVTPPDTARTRRFADIAGQIAGADLASLAKAYAVLQARPDFYAGMVRAVAPLLKRPTPLQPAAAFSRRHAGQARILLKREDTRSITPEFENVAAQCYLATQLGRTTVVSGGEVDAHAQALAVIAPRFKLKAVIVVRPEDLEGKADFVARLRGFGAEVEAAPAGMLGTDPREGALRRWQRSPATTHLVLSLGTAPSPYPAMVQNFQALLGRETELQYRALGSPGNRTLVAAVGSEADAIGFMLPHLPQDGIELMYAEPEPGGVASWRASERMRAYNGSVREHAWLHQLGRLNYVAIPDGQARTTQEQLAETEKINVSLEDARAVALAALLSQRHREPHDYVVLVA